MPIQLAGNIKHGGLFETAFGLTLGELVDDIGGGTLTGRPVRAVQVGGPLGAYFPRALFDTPFDYEAFAARDGLIGHGGIVVFDDTRRHGEAGALRHGVLRHRKLRQVHALPHRLDARRRGDRQDHRAASAPRQTSRWSNDLCNTMKFGSLCALGGFTPYPVMSALTHFPEDFGPAPRHAAGRGIEGDRHDARSTKSTTARPRSKSETMVTLTIDGQASPCRKAPRSCARRWMPASQIPKLCATDMLDAFGSCRLCLVEIEGRAGTPASCTTPVAPGMVVHDPDRAAEAASARA